MCTTLSSSLPSFHPQYPAATTLKTTTICNHPSFIKRQCIFCGRIVDDHANVDAQLLSSYNSAIPFHYIYQGMRISKEDIARLKLECTKIFLGEKNLCLVLDLDMTLLHSVSDKNMDVRKFRDALDLPENKLLREELFHVGEVGVVTKLRPFVRTFLKKANTMFKMYIYTMGTRGYANAMARLLDPEGVYFGSRVIARENCTRPNQKGLDIVLAQENVVLIIDDSAEIWPDHKDNHILVPKYKYFTRDAVRRESDGILSSLLDTLTTIHKKFFIEYNPEQLLEGDVRKVLNMVGEGCST